LTHKITLCAATKKSNALSRNLNLPEVKKCQIRRIMGEAGKKHGLDAMSDAYLKAYERLHHRPAW
jgi:hypothetical protein